MIIKILYIDDKKSELALYGGLIEEFKESGHSLIVEQKVGTQFLKNPRVFDEDKPDLILVDFVFSDVDEQGHVLGMNGVTLSNQLRQKFPDVPIILFTREEYERGEGFPHSEAILACLDKTVLKEKIIPPGNSSTIYFLISMTVGYQQMRNCTPKDWANLMRLLNAPSESIELLKKANPPELSLQKKWSTFEAATWIRKTLMEFPGIFYDNIFSATYLGISIESFQKPNVKNFFIEGKYTGPFSDQKDLWWKARLHSIATAEMNESELKFPLRKGFVKFWERKFSEKLTLSVCNYKNDSPADTVCYLSRLPVMMKYSLRYNADNRPECMDEARVSFRSIKTRDDVNFDLFDEIATGIIEDRKLKP